jgi:hypothetical protein
MIRDLTEQEWWVARQFIALRLAGTTADETHDLPDYQEALRGMRGEATNADGAWWAALATDMLTGRLDFWAAVHLGAERLS